MGMGNKVTQEEGKVDSGYVMSCRSGGGILVASMVGVSPTIQESPKRIRWVQFVKLADGSHFFLGRRKFSKFNRRKRGR